MTQNRIHPELRGLLTELAGDGLEAEGRLRLEQILAEDAASLEFYRKYMVVEASLRWQSNGVLRSPSIAPAISPAPSDSFANAGPIASVDAIDAIDPLATDTIRPSGQPSSPVLGFLGGVFSSAGEFLNRPTPFWLLISAMVLLPMASLLLVVVMSTARYERLVDERIAAERIAERIASEQLANERTAANELADVRDTEREAEHNTERVAAGPRNIEPDPISVAFLERQSSDARWASQQNAAMLGIGLQSGRRLRLTSGLAEIVFESGAKVIMQAPVTFMLDGQNAASLQDGKITAYVPPEAKGFTVQSENVTVVDLGTEFGMHVMGKLGAEVHVFTGVVEAELVPRGDGSSPELKKSTPLRLEKDVALRVAPQSVTVMNKPADPDQFVRRMPGAGVTDRPLIRNPSFEYPPIESQAGFNMQYGNALTMPLAGWSKSGPNSGYQISPYGFTLRRKQFIGPGASQGKQVALLRLTGRKSKDKPVNAVWIFQNLGTVAQIDIGKTLQTSVDIAAGRIAGAKDLRRSFGEGAQADISFATNVSSMDKGIVVGRAGVKQILLRSDGVCEITAALPIDASLLGKRLYLRLLVAKDKVDDDTEHYHFDNVHLDVKTVGNKRKN